MHCPRLDHFVRFNNNGKISCCGHMVAPLGFDSLEDMQSSAWLADVKDQFSNNTWPKECIRCQEIEQQGKTSIRQYSIKLDQQETVPDYLQVGGVLDNICNAACQTCNENCSTRIGSLSGRIFPIVDNSKQYWNIPQHRIRHLDINGGEPSFSKNYKKILSNLPPNLQTLRLNTNCSKVLHELVDVASNGVEVTVTVSCDGIGPVHDFMRWPIPWETFYKNLMTYKEMPITLNLWTTVSVLNVDDLPNIIAFAQEHGIDHSYAYLKEPVELDVNNKNKEQVDAYVLKQKQLRGLL